MSTTQHFKYHQAFPFCAGTGFFPTGFTADNLSLSDAMALTWNIETCTISFTGTVEHTTPHYVLNGSTTIVLDPFSVSSPFDNGTNNPGNMCFGPAFFGSSFASFPNINEPYQRVCNYGGAAPGLIFSVAAGDTTRVGNLAQFSLRIYTDPIHAGKYQAVIIIFVEQFYDPGVINMGIRFSTTDSGPTDLIGSGTITLWGISVPWYCYGVNAYDTSSGVGASATSSFFTY